MGKLVAPTQSFRSKHKKKTLKTKAYKIRSISFRIVYLNFCQNGGWAHDKF